MRGRLKAVVVLAFGLVGYECVAGEGIFVELGGRYNDISFIERDRGFVINEESGSIPTVNLQLGYEQPDAFYYEYQYTAGDASVDYRGYTQTGQRISSRTDYDLNSNQFIIGRKFTTTVLFVGYEVNHRDRSIRQTELTRPLTENLRQKQGLIGFEQHITHGEHYSADFRLTAKMAFSSRMRVDFDGRFDPAALHTGTDYTVTSHLSVARKMQNDWSIGLHFLYEYTEIDKSDEVQLYRNGVEVGGLFYQPYMEFETFSAGLSIIKFF